jgi:threonine aldolase
MSGHLTWNEIKPVLHIDPPYYQAATGLICLENTHNLAGGSVMTAVDCADVCSEAHALGLPVHMDGARLFNASAALEVSVADLTRHCDSVMMTLSKGLGAPAGSVLLGSREFIDKARHWRKRLGGGMRQIGILAAAGLVAIEDGPKQLDEDHQNARHLASGLAALPGVSIDVSGVVTNIVIFNVADTGLTSQQISGELRSAGVLAIGFDTSIRMVTHRDVSTTDMDTALGVLRKILRYEH